jgi:hypothetical protein
MAISPLYNKGIKMTENPMSQVNEIIQSSFESVYRTATLRERKLIGYWLEEQVNIKREHEELV